MVLDHERLDVYHLALDFLVFANGVIEALPRGRSHLADQFTRASTSIVLNLAEGAGRQDVVTLALGDLERERQSERIDDQVDLRRQAPPRSTDAVRRRPPFPPAAC